MWSFGQQLFQGCLCKLRADSLREIQAKRRQSGSIMVMVDYTKSAPDALTPTGKEQHSLPAVSARRHHLQTTHLQTSTALSWVATAVSLHCLHAAGSSATASHPVRMSPPATRRRRSRPSVNLYAGVKFWTFFDVQRRGQLISGSSYT